MQISASMLIQRNYRHYRNKYINNIIKIQSLFRKYNAITHVNELRINNNRIRYEINSREDIDNYRRDREVRQYDHRLKINYVNKRLNNIINDKSNINMFGKKSTDITNINYKNKFNKIENNNSIFRRNSSNINNINNLQNNLKQRLEIINRDRENSLYE